MVQRYIVDCKDEKGTECAVIDNFTREVLVRGLNEEAAYLRAERMNEAYNRTEEVVRQVTSLQNSGSGSAIVHFVRAMSCEHRTLQQEFTKLCVAWLDHLSKLNENQYDLRNEDSVKLAKAVTETEAWQKNKYLRTI